MKPSTKESLKTTFHMEKGHLLGSMESFTKDPGRMGNKMVWEHRLWKTKKNTMEFGGKVNGSIGSDLLLLNGTFIIINNI